MVSVAAISPCLAPRTPAQKDGLLPAMNTTPALVSQQERGHLALALRSRDKAPVQAAPGNSGRAASSGRTGVMWNAAKHRAINDVEEVEAATQATEDQPMAEEPEDPPKDYTDDEASVDDDEVYEPGNDDMEEEDDWEEVNHDDKAA
ncbi:unnamed protein product [Closterium sp. NIES-65]|nr:unnamed protein product [Closterium sp. NIES-65]